MKAETCLKIQSWVDGELPAHEAGQIERLVATDPQARALAEQLRSLKTVLRDAEIERPVPMGREEYWGGIAVALGAANQPRPAAAGVGRSRPRWWRWLVPAGLAAVLAMAWWIQVAERPAPRAPLSYAEIESLVEDSSSITFRSESERMTIVWVDTR